MGHRCCRCANRNRNSSSVSARTNAACASVGRARSTTKFPGIRSVHRSRKVMPYGCFCDPVDQIVFSIQILKFLPRKQSVAEASKLPAYWRFRRDCEDGTQPGSGQLLRHQRGRLPPMGMGGPNRRIIDIWLAAVMKKKPSLAGLPLPTWGGACSICNQRYRRRSVRCKIVG